MRSVGNSARSNVRPTLPVATTAPETTPTTAETVDTVADTPSTAAAPTTVAADSDATTRDDPAATRLRRITYALVGLGGLVLVLNLVFWKVTRPALLLPARDETTGKRSRRIGLAYTASIGWRDHHSAIRSACSRPSGASGGSAGPSPPSIRRGSPCLISQSSTVRW